MHWETADPVLTSMEARLANVSYAGGAPPNSCGARAVHFANFTVKIRITWASGSLILGIGLFSQVTVMGRNGMASRCTRDLDWILVMRDRNGLPRGVRALSLEAFKNCVYVALNDMAAPGGFM